MKSRFTPPEEYQEEDSRELNASILLHDNMVELQKSQANEMDSLLKHAEENMPTNYAEQIMYQENQLEDTKKFEKQIVALAMEVSDRIEQIQKLCAENMYDEESKQGVLRQYYARYANCFTANTVEFKALLANDRYIWERELKTTTDDIE